MALAWTVAGLCLAWVAFAHVGYPVAVWLLHRVSPRPVRRADVSEPVTVVIAVYNGEGELRAKLENTLALSYDGPVEILVASDASTDGTDAIAREFADRGVRLVRRDERGGKEAAQGLAIRHAKGRPAGLHRRLVAARARGARERRAALRRPERRLRQQRGRGHDRGRRGRLRALRDVAPPAGERDHHAGGPVGLVLRGAARALRSLAVGPGQRFPHRARGRAPRTARRERARGARVLHGRRRGRRRVDAQGADGAQGAGGADRVPRSAEPAVRPGGVLGLGGTSWRASRRRWRWRCCWASACRSRRAVRSGPRCSACRSWATSAVPSRWRGRSVREHCRCRCDWPASSCW